jgi:toxin FitB
MKLGDAIIAATALEHGVPLVTRNVDDFKHIPGLQVINPFAAQP